MQARRVMIDLRKLRLLRTQKDLSFFSPISADVVENQICISHAHPQPLTKTCAQMLQQSNCIHAWTPEDWQIDHASVLQLTSHLSEMSFVEENRLSTNHC
jgi:hypothetical protein